MAELDMAVAEVSEAESAGKGPAVSMSDKSDAGSDALVDKLGADALAGALGEVAKAAAAPERDSKSIQDRRFTIVTDHSRDALLTDFGKDTLDDRYLLPGEKYQDLFARVADAYADDQDHAQRIYDYISKLWFMPATPVLSNGGTGRGLPISCYLNSVDDSLEGIVGTWNENVWLASRGGGIGTYWGNVRGIGEPVGLNGKTSGIIPFVRVMDSLTLAISQGSLRRGSGRLFLLEEPVACVFGLLALGNVTTEDQKAFSRPIDMEERNFEDVERAHSSVGSWNSFFISRQFSLLPSFGVRPATI